MGDQYDDGNAAAKLQALLALRAAQGYVPPPEPALPSYGSFQGPPSIPPQMTIAGTSEFMVYLDEHIDYYSLPKEQHERLSNQRERLADLLLAGAKKMFAKMADYDSRVAAGTAYPYQAPPQPQALFTQQVPQQERDPGWFNKAQEMQSQFSTSGTFRPTFGSKAQPTGWQNNFARSAASSDSLAGSKRKKEGSEDGSETTKRVAFALQGKIAPKNPQTGQPQFPSSQECDNKQATALRKRSRSASRDRDQLEKLAGSDSQYFRRNSVSSKDGGSSLQPAEPISLYEQNRELMRKRGFLNEPEKEMASSKQRKPSPSRVQHRNTSWDRPPILKTPSPERMQSSMQQSAKKVCMRFLSRTCFDDHCLLWHPTTEFEIAQELKSVTTTPCLYGRKCKKDNCLFKHPQPGEPDFVPPQRDYKTFHNYHEKQKPQPTFMSVSL